MEQNFRAPSAHATGKYAGISFEVFGNQSLKNPVLYFHGLPGTKREVHILEHSAEKLGLSIVALDRPGYGESDAVTERCLLDWPEQVLEVADHLRIKKFSILGISGGGPYALACGYALPRQRVQRIGVVSSVCPLEHVQLPKEMRAINRLLFRAGQQCPWIVRHLVSMMNTLHEYSPTFFNRWQWSCSSSYDRELLEDKEYGPIIHENFTRGLKCGISPVTQDLLVITGDWGFRLEDINNRVLLWHGIDDESVPVEMGKEIAARVQGCNANFVPGWGHLLAVKFAPEILTSLVALESK